MDPFSLTVGIITLMKDTYHVAKFVYGAVKSARNAANERAEIISGMRLELLFLRSFISYFERAQGVMMYDRQMDDLWLEEIFDTVRRLQNDFNDYAKAAKAYDPDYQKFSSTPIDLAANCSLTGLSLDPSSTKLADSLSSKVGDLKNAARWSLWGQKRLSEAVDTFRTRNASLKQILIFATAAQVQQIAQPEQILDRLIKDEDAKRLGLAGHAKIRQVLAKPDSTNDDLCLDADLQNRSDSQTNSTVETSLQCCTLATRVSTWKTSCKQPVIVEYKDYPPGFDSSEMVMDSSRNSRVHLRVNQLANLLKFSGQNLVGTLECLGFINESKHNRYAFVYRFPEDAAPIQPSSLNHIIREHEANHKVSIWPLATRFSVASAIAREIGGFHADGWVHKSLRSHCIVFFKNQDNETELMMDAPYLAGFEYSRPEDGSTTGIRDDDRQRNLYRHPGLQAVAGDSFTKIHDLYSLGVVLLEIAVWCTASKIYDSAPIRSKSKPANPNRIDPKVMHEHYVRTAKSKIPYLMGESYLKAVLACLESKYSHQIFRPDFSKIFYDQVVQRLSPQCLLVEDSKTET